MTQLSLILLCIAVVVVTVVIIIRVRAGLKLQAEKKKENHRRAIKPSVDFYLKKPDALSSSKNEICIKNTGHGKAINISISDFYHPEKKDWRFKFNEISQLDPGEEKAVDFIFFVGDYKASNKTDQLWMLDPDHSHDFAARIVISYCDIEKKAYNQTITIGEDKKTQDTKMNRLQLIQKVMAQQKKRES